MHSIFRHYWRLKPKEDEEFHWWRAKPMVQDLLSVYTSDLTYDAKACARQCLILTGRLTVHSSVNTYANSVWFCFANEYLRFEYSKQFYLHLNHLKLESKFFPLDRGSNQLSINVRYHNISPVCQVWWLIYIFNIILDKNPIQTSPDSLQTGGKTCMIVLLYVVTVKIEVAWRCQLAFEWHLDIFQLSTASWPWCTECKRFLIEGKTYYVRFTSLAGVIHSLSVMRQLLLYFFNIKSPCLAVIST